MKIGSKHFNVFIKFDKDEILVGKLLLENRLIHFKYDENFINRQLDISPFRLKYNSDIQVADPDPFHGIFGAFDDSLPDG